MLGGLPNRTVATTVEPEGLSTRLRIPFVPGVSPCPSHPCPSHRRPGQPLPRRLPLRMGPVCAAPERAGPAGRVLCAGCRSASPRLRLIRATAVSPSARSRCQEGSFVWAHFDLLLRSVQGCPPGLQFGSVLNKVVGNLSVVVHVAVHSSASGGH